MLKENIVEFHSINEVKKPADKRIYHNRFNCPEGSKVGGEDRRVGKNGYKLCPDCMKIPDKDNRF